MATLNDFFPTDDIHDVLDIWIRDLMGSSFRSELKNIETLSATKTLTDADTPLQRLDCNGANRIVKMPTPDAVHNHPFFIVNSTGSGIRTLTVQSNDGGTDHATLSPNESVLCMCDGDGGYEVVGSTPLPIIREVLTANRTYYVRTDGSDSNDGLVNSSGGAFLTIQKAVDVVSSLDLSVYDVTIQLGNGTWTETVILKDAVGVGTVTIQGNAATPSNVVTRAFSKVTPGTVYTIKDMRLTGSSTNSALNATNGAIINFTNIEFNTGYTYHIQSLFGGQITAIGNYSILSGATGAHVTVRAFGGVNINSRTITLTGTPAFGTTSTFGFIEVRYCGVLFMVGNTFSGSATGRRYYVDLNGVAQTAGATLPGNAAGATATGGQYA